MIVVEEKYIAVIACMFAYVLLAVCICAIGAVVYTIILCVEYCFHIKDYAGMEAPTMLERLNERFRDTN